MSSADLAVADVQRRSCSRRFAALRTSPPGRCLATPPVAGRRAGSVNSGQNDVTRSRWPGLKLEGRGSFNSTTVREQHPNTTRMQTQPTVRPVGNLRSLKMQTRLLQNRDNFNLNSTRQAGQVTSKEKQMTQLVESAQTKVQQIIQQTQSVKTNLEEISSRIETIRGASTDRARTGTKHAVAKRKGGSEIEFFWIPLLQLMFFNVQ